MVSFILNILLQFITFLVNLLPNSSGLPTGVTDAISRMGGLLYSFDFILPITLLFSIATWIITFELGILAYRFTMWIIHLVRGN